ncbi:hypothetical protein JL722_622 [Aureococcus anophagefferens]|nr:hypothetical protein JL722_622 [Aureococcus anophagefferens]
MRTSLLAWWAAACLVRGAAAGALIVQAPDFGGGVNKTLVIVGGASIANDKYAPLGRAIQRFGAANNLSLWVAIPAFPLDTPNPAALPAEVEEAYAATFDGCAPDDVFVAGHSLGGIFSQALVHGSSYAGLVLLGSYLSTVYGCDVALGGELGGLASRASRASSRRSRPPRRRREGAKFDKPVGLALGVSHSQFASGVSVTPSGVKDLRPAVTEGAAHAAIGEIVAAFLAFQAFGAAARPDALVALAVAVDELNATPRPSGPRTTRAVGRRAPRPAPLANAAALAAARALLEGTRALDRYDATGVPFGAFSDRTVATGLGWQAAALDVARQTAPSRRPPLLATADAALCKLLPVSRAVEIALVDGLPRFDGSFAL